MGKDEAASVREFKEDVDRDRYREYSRGVVSDELTWSSVVECLEYACLTAWENDYEVTVYPTRDMKRWCLFWDRKPWD